MLKKSLWIALSAYSIIPVPQYEWDDHATRYSLCFFPVVGIACGTALAAWLWLCRSGSFGSLLFAAGATGIPLLITGGIHMDGYMDTVDALASHQSRERKLEIMKDSHCGAFAVIYCGVYLIVMLGVLQELYVRGLVAPALFGFVLSRALSGMCAVYLPNARHSGMLASITRNTQKRNTSLALLVFAFAACAGMVFISPRAGIGGILFSVLWAWYYRRWTMRQFGGVTGDTSGFFLQVCELALMIGVLAGGSIAW